MNITRRLSGRVGSRQRERGASLMLATLFMVLAVSCLALVVDTARLYVEKRKLQRVADLVALDVAMRGGLCGSGLLGDAQTLAQASAVRNGYNDNLSTAPNAVELGYLSTSAGIRAFTSSATQREVVHIRATKTVPSSVLAGGWFGNSVLLIADATARRAPLATISAGTSLLSVNSTQSPLLNGLLGGLLGSSLSLTAVQYDGIAKAKVSLLAVLNQAGLLQGDLTVGSMTELLDTSVTAAQMINATLDVLNAQGVAGASVMKTQVASMPHMTMKLGDVLGLDTSGVVSKTSQLTANVNAMDLIVGTAQAVNENSAVNVALGITGLSNVSLRVIDPKKTVLGPPGQDLSGNWRTEVKESQVKLTLDIAPSLLSLLGTTPISLSIDSATGKAHLASMNCRTAADSSTSVTVGANTSAAIVKLGAANNTAQPADFTIANINVLGLIGAKVKARLQMTSSVANSNNLSHTFVVSDEATQLPAMVTLGGGYDISSALSTQLQLSSLQTCVTIIVEICTPRTGAEATSVINTVLPLLITPLNSLVLTPVLNNVLPLMGVRLGSVDVSLMDVDVGGTELVL